MWLKQRSSTGNDNELIDTVRGSYYLSSNKFDAQSNANTNITAWNSNGFTMGNWGTINGGSETYTSWTFRKAPKFFDVVTWTGDSTSNRSIPHSLGIVPGMIIVKQTSGAGGAWRVYHRGVDTTSPQDYIMQLQDTASRATSSAWNNTAPTSSVFIVHGAGGTNADTETYVAYVFAHDTASDGIIQAGSFTTDASANAVISNLGWEPQYVMYKCSSCAGSWQIYDATRGWSYGGSEQLKANLSDAGNT